MASVGSPILVEREAPLDALRIRLEDATAGRGGTVLVQGAAGVGKTELLTALRHHTQIRTLAARGGQLERELPYGIAAQLLRPVAVDGAARAIFEDDPGDASVGDARAVHESLRRAVAAAGPLLLIVDDLHWADAASARWLSFLAPRLATEPVLLVLAARPAEPGADARSVDQLAADPAVETIRLLPLSRAGSALIVRDRLGASADDALCAACHAATGGNPFYLREVLHRLAASPSLPAADRVEGLALGDVARAVTDRLARLPAAATRLVLAVAVLGDEATLEHIAHAAIVDVHAAADLIATLVDADLLVDGDVVRFVHPIVRGAVYGRTASAERAWVHDRAARRLHAAGCGPEIVGAHLLATAPDGDAWVVDRLREAARRAARAGARREAVRLLHRALGEPPRPTVRAEVLLRLGALEASLHDGRGLGHMQQAHALERDPVRRARAALELARGLVPRGRPAAAVAVLDQAIADVGNRDARLVKALEDERAGAAWFEGDRAAERVPTGDGEKALAYRALEAALDCAPAPEVTALAERSLAGGRLVADTLVQQAAPLIAAYALILAGALSDAGRHLDAMVAATQRNGAPAPVACALGMRARQRLAAGDLDGADRDAAEALALGRDNELALTVPALDATRVEVALEREDVRGAVAALAAGAHPEALPSGTHFDLLLAARGRLRAAAGDPAAGLADLLACGERQLAWGARTPASIPWRSEAALLHPDPDRGRALVDEEVALARAAETPGPLARALRAAARFGDPVASLEEAVAAAGEARLERARAGAALGPALLAAGRPGEARAAKLAAREDALACGCSTLAARLTEMLAGEDRRRRPRPDGSAAALSRAERRVVELARTEMANRDIAAALGVSEKTVEGHLGRAYRKLGIRSRFQLADALREPD